MMTGSIVVIVIVIGLLILTETAMEDESATTILIFVSEILWRQTTAARDVTYPAVSVGYG
jgi:hypothetical protein